MITFGGCILPHVVVTTTPLSLKKVATVNLIYTFFGTLSLCKDFDKIDELECLYMEATLPIYIHYIYTRAQKYKHTHMNIYICICIYINIHELILKKKKTS